MSGLRTSYEDMQDIIDQDFAEIAKQSQETDRVGPLSNSAPATRAMETKRRSSIFFSPKSKPKLTEAFVDAGKSEIYAKCLDVCLKKYLPMESMLTDGAQEEYNKAADRLPIDDTAKRILKGDPQAIGQAYSELSKEKQAQLVGNNPFLKIYLDICAAFSTGGEPLKSTENAYIAQLRQCYLAAAQYLELGNALKAENPRIDPDKQIARLIDTTIGALGTLHKVLTADEATIPTVLRELPEDLLTSTTPGQTKGFIDRAAMLRSSYRNLISELDILGKMSLELNTQKPQHKA